ncbi:uncharacterized protein LOC121731180 [Aricia agestis]|uniref:uncharacterized protein LOC121731180 n=1 Tax=Aricia agestis TaxID=91739 RepID=UPI001C207DE0|nr:uncharacterized protein LOC121731180 [Aricia agestis]
MNDNGQRLLEFCTEHLLCVTNTFFKGKLTRKVSWKHPRSGHWHQLDVVLSRTKDIREILHTRSFHSTDCDTDHSLVAANIAFSPKRIHSSRVMGRKRLNLSQLHNDEKIRTFECLAKEMLDSWNTSTPTSVEWSNVKELLTASAGEVFGHLKTKSRDWFAENAEHLHPLLVSKRDAALKHRMNPSMDTKNILRAKKAALQRSARYFANLYWRKLGHTIQSCADRGDVGGVYDGIKWALGPMMKKTAPLKDANGDVIADIMKQLDRWVEHYTDLYSRPVSLHPGAEHGMPKLDTWIVLDSLPSAEEFNVAVSQLKNGESCDGTQAELIKLQCVRPILYHLLCKCWEAGSVPQDMPTSSRYIKEKVIEGIEKCREQNSPVYVAFIDLNKAFDTVSRDVLYLALEKIGCPPKLLSLVKSFHEDMMGAVVCDGCMSQQFSVCRGVRQGCVLAPTLFGIYFSLLLRTAFRENQQGIHLYTRADGKLFNISLLKSKRHREDLFVDNMLFADDAAFVANSEVDL